MKNTKNLDKLITEDIIQLMILIDKIQNGKSKKQNNEKYR